MSLAVAERTDFAEFLAALTPSQWDAPTLCDRWRVRDVVAHVYSYEDLGWAQLVARLLKARLNPNTANAIGVAEQRGSGADLVAIARAHTRPRGLTALLGGRIALTDTMIHHQDIRRRLGRPRVVPADRLVAALDVAKSAPTLAASPRVRGLHLAATDVGWSTGRGPLVEGAGEALLMAIAGRAGITPELTGPGVTTLAKRIDHP